MLKFIVVHDAIGNECYIPIKDIKLVYDEWCDESEKWIIWIHTKDSKFTKGYFKDTCIAKAMEKVFNELNGIKSKTDK